MDTNTMSEVKVAVLEVQVKALQDTLDEMKKAHEEMNSKLDNLLNLKQKGAGAFWLASVVFGTSIMGFFGYVFDIFKPH